MSWWNKKKQRAATQRERARRGAKQQRRMTLESLEDRRLMAISSTGIPNWQEQGPGPITNGQVVVGDLSGPNARADDFVAGAINVIAVDPQDANRVLVGTVNGGIWKTTNALSASPIWTPKTDQLPTLAITTIVPSAVDPTPNNPADNVLYAGTGSSSSSGITGAAGGLLKSIDGGEHWTRLGQSVFEGLSIQSIVPTVANNGNVIVVATSSFAPGDAAKRVPAKGGIYRSNDGGITWTRISGGNTLPDGGVTDLAVHLGSNRLYAAVSGDFDANHDGNANDPVLWSNKGIYQSSDHGETWLKVNDGLILPEDTDNKDNDGDGLK